MSGKRENLKWVVPLGVIAVTAAAAPNEIGRRQSKKVDIFWLILALVAIIGLSLAVALIGTVAVWKLLKKSDQRLPGFLRLLPGGRRGGPTIHRLKKLR